MAPTRRARRVNNAALIQEALEAQNDRQTRRTTRHELQAMNNALKEAQIVSSDGSGGAGGGNLATGAALFNAVAAAMSDEPSADEYNAHLNEDVPPPPPPPPPPPAPINKPCVQLPNAVEEEEEEDLPSSPPPPPPGRRSARARTPSAKAQGVDVITHSPAKPRKPASRKTSKSSRKQKQPAVSAKRARKRAAKIATEVARQKLPKRATKAPSYPAYIERVEPSPPWEGFSSSPAPYSSPPPAMNVEYMVILRTEGAKAVQLVEERSMDTFVLGESHNYGKVLVWIDTALEALSYKVQPRVFERVKLCCVVSYERLAEKSRPAMDVNLCDDFDKVEAFMRRFNANRKKGLTLEAICYVKVTAAAVEASIAQPAEALLSDPGTAHLSGQLDQMRAFMESLVSKRGRGASSATSLHRMSLPNDVTLELASGNTGVLLTTRWRCQNRQCNNYTNTCWHPRAIESANRHYKLDSTALTAWGEMVKRGEADIDNIPPEVMERLVQYKAKKPQQQQQPPYSQPPPWQPGYYPMAPWHGFPPLPGVGFPAVITLLPMAWHTRFLSGLKSRTCSYSFGRGRLGFRGITEGYYT
ncbi:hypothetical protein B0J12DRAFT_398155 [Macrophomina phaseolina]|uniref:Uncharacterized protein n=1 Tax=Macrophomina phaseolina TaxID=35725 RepID=A0ABQ8GI22_9PEZI|nr:hypothetical protein B0J12DRAFT_398155 [Macrophomina phaseolina]